MNFKRISAAALALAMTASLSAVALADELPEGWTPADGARLISGNPFAGNYDTVITINGETLESYEYTRDIPDTWETETITVELSTLPNVPEGYVPLRAVAQADHGSASWFKDENQSFFMFNDADIIADFNDMSVSVNKEKVEGAQVILMGGVTYIPVSVLESIEGVTVTDNSADGVESYEISTPNGAPLMKMAYDMMEVAGIYGGMQSTPEELEQYWGETHGFKAEFVTEAVVFTGMMTTPDTLGVGKVAEGQEEALAAAFESYRKQQEETFSWYLSHNLPKVENAKFVTEGEWFLFVIGETADEAVEQFRAAVQAMNEAQG
ncbi:MAG: DUF4358 domain-containing protein [Oscillospiraceae bacterium]|nr:DUF4358 domain-containing protein [Oscillospiraceae bacterium]MBP3521729.1 DUF4358 domain-containing protein [Oscillospiraceae bacterium]